MKRIVLFVFVLAFGLPAQADQLDEFVGVWSVAKLNDGAEYAWAQENDGWQLFLEIKKEGNADPTIGMYYRLGSGLIPVNVFDAHTVDDALMVMTSFDIPGEHVFTSTQYRFPFKAGKRFGEGEYYEVREFIAGPDGETGTESVSGDFKFKKKISKK
jgi:hypothetical protein